MKAVSRCILPHGQADWFQEGRLKASTASLLGSSVQEVYRSVSLLLSAAKRSIVAFQPCSSKKADILALPTAVL